jgi:hypothetical protein
MERAPASGTATIPASPGARSGRLSCMRSQVPCFPSRASALHRPVPSQPQMEPVATLLAPSKPQGEHALSLNYSDLSANPVPQSPLEARTGQPPHSPAALASRPIFTARHAQDAVFERWGDGVLDVLTCGLSTKTPSGAGLGSAVTWNSCSRVSTFRPV